jgi:hypothetical protein
MDPGIIIVLGLALLFFAGIGYTAWKEHKRRGLQVADPPIWSRNDGTRIEESKKGKY